MRITTALILFVLTCWRGYLDMQANGGIVPDFQMAPVADVWQAVSLSTYQTFVPQLMSGETMEAIRIATAVLLASPALPIMFGLSVFFFAIRRRERQAKLAYTRHSA